MTNKEKAELLKIGENTVIHYPTEELAKEICGIFHRLGLTWKDGVSYIERSCHNGYKDHCHNPISGTCGFLNYYREDGYNIISAQDFIKRHTKLNDKIFISGDSSKKESIRRMFENLNVDTNSYIFSRCDLLYYPIDGVVRSIKNTRDGEELLRHAGYREVFVNIDTVNINGKTYELTPELEKIINNLKEIKL